MHRMVIRNMLCQSLMISPVALGGSVLNENLTIFTLFGCFLIMSKDNLVKRIIEFVVIMVANISPMNTKHFF
jgi:hypothetical protein